MVLSCTRNMLSSFKHSRDDSEQGEHVVTAGDHVDNTEQGEDVVAAGEQEGTC